MNHTIDSGSPLTSRRASICHDDLDTESVDVSVTSKFGGITQQSKPFIPKSTWNVGASSFVPATEAQAQPEAKAAAPTETLGLSSLSLNDNFTPSTPYVHKFRTEMCKNFMMYGKCKYGDEVSKENNFEKDPLFRRHFQITQIQITHEPLI